MTPQRVPKGSQDDQKGRPEANKRVPKTDTEKRDENGDPSPPILGWPGGMRGALGEEKGGVRRTPEDVFEMLDSWTMTQKKQET